MDEKINLLIRADTMPIQNGKRRDSFSIFAEILDVARNGALKTHLMYGAKLNYSQVNKHIKSLQDAQLLKKVQLNEKSGYETTQRGFEFLQAYTEIKVLVSPNSHNSRIPIRRPKRVVDLHPELLKIKSARA